MNDLKSIEIGKYNVEYYDEGNDSESKTNIVLLHGLGSRPEYFDELIFLLKGKYRIITPRLYGLNYFIEQPVSFEEYYDLTKEFISKLVASNCHVVGHSYGAVMAMALLSQEELILSAISINPMLPTPETLSELLAHAKPGFKTIFNTKGEVAGLFSNPSIIGSYISNFAKDPMAYLFTALSGMKISITEMKSDKPCLLLHGKEDAMFQIDKKIERTLIANYPNIEINLLEGYSHNWPLYHIDLAYNKICGFIS